MREAESGGLQHVSLSSGYFRALSLQWSGKPGSTTVTSWPGGAAHSEIDHPVKDKWRQTRARRLVSQQGRHRASEMATKKGKTEPPAGVFPLPLCLLTWLFSPGRDKQPSPPLPSRKHPLIHSCPPSAVSLCYAAHVLRRQSDDVFVSPIDFSARAFPCDVIRCVPSASRRVLARL